MLRELRSIEDVKIPFQVGEKLSYVLKWSVIPVGEAELKVSDEEANIGSVKIDFRTTKPILIFSISFGV